MAIYQRIKAWERCHELCVAVYQATKSWPVDERFGLILRHAEQSIRAAANIAEGSAKNGSAESRRYLNISLGSLSELSYTLMLAKA
jgi:four helix bundle protein